VAAHKVQQRFLNRRSIAVILKESRKESNVSLEKFVQDQIDKAIAEGEFDNLAGEGKPLDLEWYFKVPEHLRLTYSVLKNSNAVPEEVELLREVAALRENLTRTENEGERGRINREINQKILSLRLLLERMTK
jgi:hypothetical protein